MNKVFHKTLLVLLLVSVSFLMCAQTTSRSTSFSEKSILEKYLHQAVSTSLDFSFAVNLRHLPINNIERVDQLLKTKQPKTYNYNNLGMFCKLDVQLQNASGVAIRIRIGDPQYEYHCNEESSWVEQNYDKLNN